MALDPALIGPTTLGITQAVGAMNSFLPPLSEVRKKTPENHPEFAADVRMGEVAVVTLTVGVGVIVSSLTGSSAPALIGLITALGIVVMYESILRSDSPMEVK